jgi:hypothetical protein
MPTSCEIKSLTTAELLANPRREQLDLNSGRKRRKQRGQKMVPSGAVSLKGHYRGRGGVCQIPRGIADTGGKKLKCTV